MALLPPAFTARLTGLAVDGRWPDGLTTEGLRSLSSEIEALLATLEPAVATAIGADLQAEERSSVLRGVGMARITERLIQAGHKVVRPLDGGLFEVHGPSGPFLLAPAAFSFGDVDGQAALRRRRMVHALEALFEGKRYIIDLRKPLTSTFDPLVLVQPITSWLMAVERGQWEGDYAIYEDADVAIELCVVEGPPRPDGRGLLFLIPPPLGEQHLGDVVRLVLDLAVAHEELDPPLPIVPLLLSDTPWSVPHGVFDQVIYGRPVEACFGDIDQATFEPAAGSLFIDPQCRAVAGLWWLTPDDRGELMFRAHDNPWSDHAERIPRVRGRRRSAITPAGGIDRQPATLRWVLDEGNPS